MKTMSPMFSPLQVQCLLRPEGETLLAMSIRVGRSPNYLRNVESALIRKLRDNRMPRAAAVRLVNPTSVRNACRHRLDGCISAATRQFEEVV